MFGKLYTFLALTLFQYPKTTLQFRIRWAFVIVIFLMGVTYWIYFFSAGDLSLVTHDWIKEKTYMRTLREAQIIGTIPWMWQEPLYQGTRYFLANPEVCLTPDILFLPWVSDGVFVLIHVLILYTIGFFGSCYIAKKCQCSLIAFFFFYILLNFNGYITSHLAVGHFQWTGYFFLPIFFIILYKFSTHSQNKAHAIIYTLSMALLFATMFLNGSFHIAIWCMMFMLIALVWQPAMFASVFGSIIVGILLGMNRILPAAIFLHDKRHVYTGFSSILDLIDGFTVLHNHTFRGNGALGWWEFDIFIGFVGLFGLLAGLFVAFSRKNLIFGVPFIAAGIVFLLFSMGYVYNLVGKLPFPFASIERVPSRFIVMPFIVFLVIAMTGIDNIIRIYPKQAKICIIAGLPFVCFELFVHSFHWRVARLESGVESVYKPAALLVDNLDERYMHIVYVSWFTSLAFLICVIFAFFIHWIMVNRKGVDG